MKQNTLSKIQIVIAIVVAIYVVMPDLFIGPIDDAVIAAIAGVVEVVLGVMRAISKTNSGSERMTDRYDNYGSYDNYRTY